MSTSSRDTPTNPPTPRWVKLFGIIAIALVLLIVVALATGLGGPGAHGPARHLPGGEEQIHPEDGGGHVPAPDVPEHDG